MAINYTLDTFKIYDAEFNSAYIEALQMNVNIWNQSGAGTIVLSTESLKGNFEKRAIFKELASSTIIKHRDPSSVASITAETLDQIEQIGVKLNRYSFIQKTADAFAKLAVDPNATFSQIVGVATAEAQVEDAVNTIIGSLVGAIGSEATMVHGDGTAEMNFKDVNALRFAFGDKFNNVKALFMHSSTASTFVDLNIDEKMNNVGGVTINTGKFASLGIPVVIVDSPSFAMTAGKAVLALTPEAGVVIDSEAPRVYTDFDVTSENTMLRIKRETAMNILIKGYSYTKGTASPTNTVLFDKASWGKIATDMKNTAGAIFNTKS